MRIKCEMWNCKSANSATCNCKTKSENIWYLSPASISYWLVLHFFFALHTTFTFSGYFNRHFFTFSFCIVNFTVSHFAFHISPIPPACSPDKTDCSVDVVLLLCCSTAPQISNHIPTAIRVSLSLRLLHNIASKHSFASPQHSHQLATPTHLWFNF